MRSIGAKLSVTGFRSAVSLCPFFIWDDTGLLSGMEADFLFTSREDMYAADQKPDHIS